MHRISRLLPGRQVTLRIAAICRPDLKTVVGVDVTGETSYVRVAKRERKTGRVVIKSCA